MKKRTGYLALVLTGMLALSACSAQPESASSAIQPVAGSTVTAPCDAVKVGIITRCQNFYKDYWPVINKNLNMLYKKAKATDGGDLVIWDWYSQPKDIVAAFNKRFPGIKVVSRGLNYNLPSAVIAAKASGARNTDIVSGSIVSTAALYNQGYWAKIDWAKFGVPKQFLTVGAPEMLPDSINGSLMQYNSAQVTPPTTLEGLLDPKYKGKVSIASYNPVVFEGYGKANGTKAMDKLIKQLKSSGTMKLVDNQDTPLSSGDLPIALNQTLDDPNPALKLAAFQDAGVFAQFSGVNVDASNKAGAMLWILWNAYDPTWLKERMTEPQFATTQVPYAGLPSSVFAEGKGLMKKNADALLQGLTNGNVTETQAARKQWIAINNAADKALNG